MVYMVASQTGHPQKLAFAFLRDIKGEWEHMYSRFDCVRAGPEQMTHSFKPILTKKMVPFFLSLDHFNSNLFSIRIDVLF